MIRASYLDLYESGALQRCANELNSRLHECSLCPHHCKSDRTKGRTGKCRTGSRAIISSFNAHFGEEAPLVGHHGSGTIFFAYCNLSCIYCQNYDISHLGRGEEISCEDLAEVMLNLQHKGCHNINFVSPTHVTHAIVSALLLAIPQGLKIPLVYNSGGYEDAGVLRLLEGIFDIYMPDIKYMDPDIASRLSGAHDYPSRASEAIREMHRQVGDLVIDRNGIARRGLLVRHLVLPNNIAATDRVIRFIADLSKNTYLNIMDQYRPEYRAREFFDLRRRITMDEYDAAVQLARNCGLSRIDSLPIK